MKIWDALKRVYARLSPNLRRILTIGGAIAAVAVVFSVAVMLGGGQDSDRKPRRQKGESISLDTGLMEETIRESVTAETRVLGERIDRMEAALSDYMEAQAMIGRLESPAGVPAEPVMRDEFDPEDLAPRNELGDGVVLDRVAVPPPVVGFPEDGAESDLYTDAAEPVETRIIGGIGGLKPVAATETQADEQRRVFLPVSFMEAVLLTGLDALVGQQAMNNPEPVIARVQAPAVLPNAVRANLQGCFVVGNGIGILAKERVDVRAVSLSCVDIHERVVIDQPIKGFFVDADGKKGLSGNVVTRDGAIIGQAFAAGLLEGFGAVAQASAGVQTISPLGATRVFDVQEAAIAGLGQGVAGTANSLRDYYLDLARTVTPVIEIGTSKTVVLVIQEGTFLEIKEVEDVAGH
ncbi:TraB/VirB10 family protein [Eilatimonas milleporae]|uniref:Conjugative transfer protein TrbI n=1 Tax=Eilatimonas milleporae TaxID=911205 RepID=A0A3M0C5F1_9PROT|nr:TraB/VirB10 family protein [Eilatimonas milleporae]RMB05044.1 conjugative transfer protein TrbI [Eilatimonas milleporae]